MTAQGPPSQDADPDGWSRSLLAFVVVLTAVALLALGVASLTWGTVGEPGSRSNALFSASLQVLGVAVLGGVAAFAFNALKEQYAATLGAREKLRERKLAERDLAVERLREEFEVRADLLRRTSASAQRMYVMCQHVSRVLSSRRPDEAETHNGTRKQLHTTYLQFSSEAAALETELEARFGSSASDPRSDQEDAGTNGATPAEATRVPEPMVGLTADGVTELWHQLWDLLTIYYFALDRRFPGGALAKNSAGFEGRVHSGLPLSAMVHTAESPTEAELEVVLRSIRKAFTPARRALGHSIRSDELLR